MNFLWFRDLAALRKTGSFSRAAELANVTQPALSRRVKAIEAWVGAELVDRSTHPVQLTSAGNQMLEAGRQALARIETERDLILGSLASPDQYVVTFAAQHSIGWRFYPAWLQAFEDGFGPVMSRLRADNLPACIDALKDGDVDFVIAYQSDYSRSVPPMSGVESVSIGGDALVPVCKPHSDGRPLFRLDEVDDISTPFLRFGGNAPIGRHVEPLLRARGIAAALRVVYENAMSGALRIRAREGAGIAWLPHSLVRPDLEEGRLVLAGDDSWRIRLDVRLHRLNAKSNALTREIWSFMSAREGIPLTRI